LDNCDRPSPNSSFKSLRHIIGNKRNLDTSGIVIDAIFAKGD
jgi:hypothetical protein